jgi:hypothetical protein
VSPIELPSKPPTHPPLHPPTHPPTQAGYDLSADYRITPTAVNGPAEAPAMYYNAEEYSDFRAPPTLPKRADAILAAFISNCDEVSTSRLAVLRELAALIPVHSYGACAHAAPGEASRGERDFGGAKVKVIRDYAFTFAAENSEEPGYVTEKVGRGGGGWVGGPAGSEVLGELCRARRRPRALQTAPPPPPRSEPRRLDRHRSTTRSRRGRSPSTWARPTWSCSCPTPLL